MSRYFSNASRIVETDTALEYRECFRELARRLPLILMGTLIVLVAMGLLVQYSAGDGNFHPWFWPHAIRMGGGFVLLLLVVLIDIRFWLQGAYLLYLGGLGLLLVVEFLSVENVGVSRWISVGGFNFQPSEIMKVGVVLALARYFHFHAGRRLLWTEALAVGLLVAAPAYLVFRQPDLGTATVLVMVGTACAFLAGIDRRLVLGGALFGIIATPLVWIFALRDYQKDRLLTFFNPEADPLGAGYHAIQSKIAIGSGGLQGKGYLEGTQSHLDFIPALHTDFVFSIFAEEFGFVGSLALIGLHVLIPVCGAVIASQTRSHFGRIVAASFSVVVFLYLFVNVAMTVTLLPVVGSPLPPISYGGTAAFTLFACVGLMINVYIHRDRKLP